MLVIDQLVGKIDDVLRTQASMVSEIREKERELLDKVRVHRNPSSRCSLFDRQRTAKRTGQLILSEQSDHPTGRTVHFELTVRTPKIWKFSEQGEQSEHLPFELWWTQHKVQQDPKKWNSENRDFQSILSKVSAKVNAISNLEFSTKHDIDATPLSTHEKSLEQAVPPNTQIFPGPFNPVGFEIVGEITCYQKFELNFETKIDKLVLKDRVRISFENKGVTIVPYQNLRLV